MAPRKSHFERQWRGEIPSSIALIDKLPRWAKVVFIVFGGAGFLYSVAHYGLGSTMLHAIFSP